MVDVTGPMERGGGERPTGEARWDMAAVLFAMAFPTAAAWLYFLTFANTAWMTSLYGGTKLIQFALPVVWVFLLRRRRPSIDARSRGGLAAGLATGGGMAGLVLLGYFLALRGGDLAGAAAPRIAARVEAVGAGSPARFVLMALFLSLIHSFLEEYYWRWFVFGQLRRWISGPASVLLSSLAFMSHHVIIVYAFLGFGRLWWATVLFSLAVAAAGAVWAWLYTRNGSLISPWLSHVLVDLAVMAVGYDLAAGLL